MLGAMTKSASVSHPFHFEVYTDPISPSEEDDDGDEKKDK